MSITVFYSGNTEVRPGEVVLLGGGNLESISAIKVGRLSDKKDSEKPAYIAAYSPVAAPDGEIIKGASSPISGEQEKEVEAIQQNTSSVKFIIPQDFKRGIFAATLVCSCGEEETVYINAPILKWIQGNTGAGASAGGWLRLCGENLMLDENVKPSVIFEKNGKLFDVNADFKDAYSASVNIPSDLENGEYKVYVSNGFGGNTAWSMPVCVTISDEEKNPEVIFNILDYGADLTGEEDTTEAFRAALRDVEKNGGGVVYIPRGRYMLTGTLELPDRTTLRGESAKRSQLFWLPFQYEFGSLPDAYIKGNSDITIEELDFRGTRVNSLMIIGHDNPDAKNIILRNIRANFNALSGSEYHITELENRMKVYNEVLCPRSSQLIVLHGSNIQVTGSFFYNVGMTFGVYKVQPKNYFFFSGNSVHERSSGWANFSLVEKAIIENNEFEGCTIGCGGAHVYLAHNYVHDAYNNDRESFTTDLSYSTISAKPVSVDGNIITFGEQVRFREDRIKNGGLYINTGRGKGQLRKVKCFHDNVIELEEPYAVQPDSESELCFGSMFRTTYYIIGNTIFNGGHIQFYCDQVNSVIEGNKASRSAGLMVYGWQEKNKVERPDAGFDDFTRTENQFISIVNNVIEDGNYVHKYGKRSREKGMIDGWSGYSSIGSRVGGSRPSSNGLVIRRNTLSDNSFIQIIAGRECFGDNPVLSDMIVENNDFHSCRKGIELLASCATTVVRGNDISDDVDFPIVLPDSKKWYEDVIFEDNKI